MPEGRIGGRVRTENSQQCRNPVCRSLAGQGSGRLCAWASEPWTAVGRRRAEALRLTSLGTTELTRSAGWVTMPDPEGNKFDILAAEGIDIATWAEELPPSAAARGQSRSSVRASS